MTKDLNWKFQARVNVKCYFWKMLPNAKIQFTILPFKSLKNW